MNIDLGWKTRFEKVWDEGNYRQGSTALRMTQFIMASIPAGSTINDYGSGTGRAEVELITKSFYRINMIDIADNALEAPALEILQRADSPLKFFLADLTDLSAVPYAEWGICINVLMTVQPDKLNMILSEIRRTCGNLIMEAYDLEDNRLGWQMTTVKKNAAEWMDTLREYWPRVEFTQSKEHSRRYIFVCRKSENVIPNACEESKISPVGRNDKKAENKSAITITAGWSGDEVYSIEDVNRLIRGVRRNTTIPHDFILYAGPEAQKHGKLNGLESGVTVIPSEYPSWWVGMQGSDPDNRPWIKTDSIFGLGLDCVIVGSLDDLIMFPSDLASMKDYPAHCCPAGKENDCNLEVVLIRNNSDRPLWNEYVRVGKPTWDCRNIPSNAVFRMCGQGWVNETRAIHVDLFPENWIASYKLAVRGHGLPDDCRIVSFHGRPKPGEVEEEWLKDHWK